MANARPSHLPGDDHRSQYNPEQGWILHYSWIIDRFCRIHPSLSMVCRRVCSAEWSFCNRITVRISGKDSQDKKKEIWEAVSLCCHSNLFRDTFLHYLLICEFSFF